MGTVVVAGCEVDVGDEIAAGWVVAVADDEYS
jgi:hypothetical protein